jgi:molybdate transport system substrate-binding protein
MISPGVPIARAEAGLPRRALLLAAAAAPWAGARDQPGPLAGTLTLAAAADLRFALDEVVAQFRARHPGLRIEVIYGSSGKLSTQIRNGAPFDLYFSADRAFADALFADGHAATAPRLYGVGVLVSWSLDAALGRLPLAELARDDRVRRLAIANPEHAPYGQRAVEALRAQGVLAVAQPKLVMGENVAQAAQFVQTGSAQAGLVALSLVLAPALAGQGAWTRIPAAWHAPLEQAFVVTRRAAGQPAAAAMAAHLQSPEARGVLRRYGFGLPGE